LQSAGLATSLLHKKWEGHVPSPLFERRQRQNRRAYGAAAGEKTGGDGCSHLKVPVFSPVTGDPIACHSAFKKLYRTPGVRLFVGAGGWVELRALGVLVVRGG
jgi:hypothetical protein